MEPVLENDSHKVTHISQHHSNLVSPNYGRLLFLWLNRNENVAQQLT